MKFESTTFVLCLLLSVLGCTTCAFGAMRETLIDASALNFPTGPYGSAINGQTFQQEALISFNDYQYASYFADGGVLCVARRHLPDGVWEVIRFPDYRMAPHNDVHNVATIGVCREDGTLHLAFDHHVNNLRYRRSIKGVASDPSKFKWTPELFGPITSELESGRVLEAVTYPMFFSTPQGRLQMIYRTGWSGHGDWHLAEYDPVNQWKILGVLLSGEGTFDTSPSRCAYPNAVRYGPGARLHLSWCWRENPPGEPLDLRTNHDLCYAYSDDFGRTWKNNAGVEIARLSTGGDDRPITVSSPGSVVYETKFRWGQMNTTTEHVDTKGRVHIVSWQNPPEASAATQDTNQWRYYHYYGQPGQKWTQTRLPFYGRKPQVVVGKQGGVWVIFTKGDDLNYSNRSDTGGRLMIAAARDAGTWTKWEIVWTSDRDFVGEPLLDYDRWDATGILSIYAQEKPAKPGAPSALRVLDFQP
ncbi:MAG TPA: BNR repeat-containing protein [Rariglobus sp.]|nr:BNR repeat-containing protein [Rariglobus sp.]